MLKVVRLEFELAREHQPCQPRPFAHSPNGLGSEEHDEGQRNLRKRTRHWKECGDPHEEQGRGREECKAQKKVERRCGLGGGHDDAIEATPIRLRLRASTGSTAARESLLQFYDGDDHVRCKSLRKVATSVMMLSPANSSELTDRRAAS